MPQLTDNTAIGGSNTQQEAPSTEDLLSGFSFLSTIVDGNTDVFRYGIFNNPENEIEDPTILGFTMEIDDQSPLFTEVEGFIAQYKNYNSEIAARESVYAQFKENVVKFFKSQESAISPTEKGIYIKSHYINSVTGMANLNKKFVNYGEDRLTVQLHEDLKLHSSYLAMLYNNLTYSYDSGRELLPINLRRFNLHIKVSEIRNITNIRAMVSNNASEQAIAEALKKNLTSIVYTLHECYFDFFGSNAHGDSIAQAGIDAGVPGYASLNLDIYYKSVSRFVRTPLIPNAIAMYDGSRTLGFTKTGSTSTNKSDTRTSKTNANGDPYQPKLADDYVINNSTGTFLGSTKKASVNANLITALRGEDKAALQQQSDERDILAEQFAGEDYPDNSVDDYQAANPFIDKIKNKARDKSKLILMRAKNKLKGQIRELTNELLYDVKKDLGIKQIVPDNVYTGNQNPIDPKNIFEDAKSILGIEATNALNNILGTIF